MDKHGRQTACCGAGGGRMWMEESRGTRINEARTAMALETGAAAIVTSCPFCMTMLRDGVTAARPDGSVTTLDIAEVLAEVAVPGPTAAFGARTKGRELPVIAGR